MKSEFHGIEGVIEYCKQYERNRGRDIPWHRVLYYHCELKSGNGIAIEPHYRISYLHSPVRNHRLQKWFDEQFLDVIPSRDGRRCNQQEPLGSAASLCEEHKTTLCPQADGDEWS